MSTGVAKGASSGAASATTAASSMDRCMGMITGDRLERSKQHPSAFTPGTARGQARMALLWRFKLLDGTVRVCQLEGAGLGCRI
ncbi:MAG: hypothetical protein ACYC8T_39070 [Myxococcaceae bacterium]